MKRSEFETMLTVGIATHRLALMRDAEDRDLIYSGEMHSPEDAKKIYLIELYDEYFILRSDLIFDESVQRFFYVTKERFEYTESNFKHAMLLLRRLELKVYEILAKLGLRGFLSKKDFVNRIMEHEPRLELLGNAVKDRKSGKTFITIKEEILHFVYKDGKTESFMDLAKKDFNEKILQQCIDLIAASLKTEGA
ncbi:MAG: hypothetical protein FWC26_02720 [Fibromonadales bacterium]|nr:hypothetical protein [Fibromonadales bacterium]